MWRPSRTNRSTGTVYYLGIDLDKHESHVAVFDDDAEVVEEIRVTNANLDEVAEEYAGAKAALEATSNYYTVYDTLNEHLNVVVADLTRTNSISYAEVKNDRLDAKLREHSKESLSVGVDRSAEPTRSALKSLS